MSKYVFVNHKGASGYVNVNRITLCICALKFTNSYYTSVIIILMRV